MMDWSKIDIFTVEGMNGDQLHELHVLISGLKGVTNVTLSAASESTNEFLVHHHTEANIAEVIASFVEAHRDVSPDAVSAAIGKVRPWVTYPNYASDLDEAITLFVPPEYELAMRHTPRGWEVSTRNGYTLTVTHIGTAIATDKLAYTLAKWWLDEQKMK